MLKAPLDVAVPYPLIIETAPPVLSEAAVLSPADTVMRPPVERFPLPITILTLPAVHLVAEPVRRVMFPLLPLVVEPEVSEREPETPSAPAFAERTLKAPLEVARP
jgi:hypothetical protein